MAIKITDSEDISFNKDKKIKKKYIFSLISIIILIITFTTLIVLYNKYDIACDSMKDNVIACYITKTENAINDQNWINHFIKKECQKNIENEERYKIWKEKYDSMDFLIERIQ
jgi:uncharacterized ion transporter superfamily protein YfcC